ncbi:MAG: glycosyltransferase [Flavobacteriaceae bacterium]|jgi:glycosyltransferase involved in cell wall biosynthesis|nr:glycosyltransferase [Flavobacteriaceae bacterium]
MNGNKTVTVVIASYKYGHLAAHCIESILSQTVLPDKILFVDDGVGDCKHLPKIYPQVEYILRRKNLGTASNFQDMLNRVQTDYCLFIGADNWLRSDAIELLKKVDADVVTYDIIVTGEIKDELLDGWSEKMQSFYGDFYWDREGGHHGSIFYNVKLAKKVGYRELKEGRRYSTEDLRLWNGLLESGAKVGYIKEGLLYYRRHKENFNKYGKYFSPNNNSKGIKRIIKKIYYKLRYNYEI